MVQMLTDIKSKFPILHQEVNGFPLVYLDNAATSQKPTSVIDAIANYYSESNSNIHRGAHYLANKATIAYEEARTKIANFINAPSDKLINFTKGTTDSINLVANSYVNTFLKAGDEIILTGMDHHSNIVPWQMAAKRVGATIKYIPFFEDGSLDIEAFENLLSDKTKIVSIAYVSNALGTIHPVEHIIKKAHEYNAVVLLDAAQAVPHLKVDVQALDADFIAFSGHKMYGPTGIGILYGKEELLEKMEPYQGGGEMIKEVKLSGSTYNDLPFKFEAGTPNICGGIALGAAVDFINETTHEFIQEQELTVLAYGTDALNTIEGLSIKGTSKNKTGVLSFMIDGLHPYDIGVLLDKMGIAIRTGHHCCQPLMDAWNIPGTARASLAVYNTKEDIDKLVMGIEKAKTMLS